MPASTIYQLKTVIHSETDVYGKHEDDVNVNSRSAQGYGRVSIKERLGAPCAGLSALGRLVGSVTCSYNYSYIWRPTWVQYSDWQKIEVIVDNKLIVVTVLLSA